MERLAEANKKEEFLKDKQRKLEEKDSVFREEVSLREGMKRFERQKHIQYLKRRQAKLRKAESNLTKMAKKTTETQEPKSDTESVLSEGDYPRVFMPFEGMRRLKKGELKEVDDFEIPHKRQVIERERELIFNQTRGKSGRSFILTQIQQYHQPPRSYSAHPQARVNYYHSHSRRAVSLKRYRSTQRYP